MNHLVKIFYISLFFISCSNNFDGYTSINNDVHYKLLSFEEESKQYNIGDYLIADITISEEDEVVYKHFKYVPLKLKNLMFDNTLTQFNVGDSVEILMFKETFDDNELGFSSEIIKSEYVKMYVKVHDFINEEEYASYEIQRDEELIEQQILKQYLTSLEKVKSIDGVHFVKLKETSGRKVEIGSTINIKYFGTFINGVVFDTTFVNKSFEFSFGTPNQVVEGIEKVLKVLKNGEKAKIIIPSQFAFGDEGSSTGIVPPYSTVIYNLEIINIK